MSAVNFSLSREASGDRPIVVSAGQASSTYLRRLASALGAGSVATTSNPRARYCAAQLAPMTPVPTIATRRTGLLNDISALRCGKFGVGNAGEIALGVEEVALVRSVEIGGIDRSGEVGDEHPVARNVDGEADSLHQVRDQNLWCRVGVVDRHAIDGIAARRIAAVGPIEDAVRPIQLEIDGFGQVTEQHLDVGAVRWALAAGNVYIGPAETAQSALRRALL